MALALLGGSLRAVASEPRRLGEGTRQRLMQSLPAYDPSVRTAALAEGGLPAPAPVSRGRGPKLTAKAREAEAGTELPAVIVEAPRAGPRPEAKPAPLPLRPQVERFHRVEAEPFETAAMTEQRLAKTYLSDLDRQVLNRVTLPFVGRSQGERARELARIDESAEALNRLAQMIAALEAAGVSPDEAKALREEYARMFFNRPR